ncbi:MAG: XRE family transcriptional regulator [Fournierella sp.]|uniref:XRE family transcriptional regulator n=1 Tax=Allofournierella sp. TaxID=1940256 RepID=UPI002A812243|nr:XRE family transcriptional regulator [Fournierella sp.]MDY4166110.1 XRE family transcriptional regulator [Fournierella sp.]
MAKVCDFGKEIKKRLVDLDQSQEWLIAEVAKDTGKYFDSGYLHRILRGEIATPGIVASICKILELNDDHK